MRPVSFLYVISLSFIYVFIWSLHYSLCSTSLKSFLTPCRVPVHACGFQPAHDLSHITANITSSVQFSHSVVSNSLQPHEWQHARPPCPSPIPGVYTNLSPSSQWCHPAISSSVIPFSSCPQSLPSSGSVPMSQLFAWGGQSIGVSASASVLLMNTRDWSPLGWTGWISLQSSPTPQFKSINFSAFRFLHSPTLTSIHDHWKNHSRDQTDLYW